VKRSVDVLTSHQSPALSTSAVLNAMAVLHVLIRHWTTVEPSGLVRLALCQETGTTHLANHMILGLDG